MKRFLNSIVFIAATSMALLSCQKEQNSPVEDKIDIIQTVKLTVRASAENLKSDTKTYIDGNAILWGTGEYMTAAIIGEDSFTTYSSNSSSADLWDGKSKAMFEFDVTLDEGTYTYGGIYPTSAVVVDNNTTANAFKVNLSAVQSATAASYDPSAYIMIAKPEVFTQATTKWDASFRRTTALNKITLTGLEDNITSVIITVPEGKYLAGRRYMDLTTGDKGEVYNGGGRTNALTINYSTPIASDVEDKDIWFTSWGVEIPKDAKMTIVAYSGNFSYTREITAREGGIKFNEGFLNTLSINMASAVKESLIDYSGDYLIVSTTHLLTDYNTSNYYNYVEAAGEELSDFWEIDGIENYVWTVSKLDDGSYSFYNAGTGKYLALTEDLNKAHEAENADENTARFTITEDNSALTIYSKAYPERKLRYNTSSPRFAFYSSNTGAIATLLEYTTDLRTPFDVVSGLTWDASGKTLSWTATDGATNGYEYTTDNGTTVTASETNSIDCSSWSNGDYSVKVRVVGTEEKKTSQWSDACEFTISGGATTSILSFDFVTHPSGWPAAKADAAKGSYSYTLNNETYTFTHSKEGDGIYCGGTSITSGYLMVAKNNVLGLPAIDGCKLTKVVGTLNGSGSPSTKSEVSITDGTDVITGGASQTWNTKGGSYTYNLTNTEENTVYYLSVSSTANCQITTLELTYEITSPLASIDVSGTPTKTAYSVGEAFDTDGLVVTATYADASQKDITNSVDWTVTPETLTAGTTSVKVVATYKGVTSNEYVVNGLSVKELSTISVKTAPTKTTYTEGEKFNPAGLVIYRNYSDETKDEYAYADHEDEFTFVPDLATALATSYTSVTITYSGKSVSQAITVNEKPALETMDAIFAAATAAGSTATDAKVKFDSWVVSGVKNNNAYLTDNNGKGLIIYTSGHGFAVGDILNGTVNCKVQLYKGAAELTFLTSTTEGLTVTKGGSITPATISIANLSGVNTGAVITFESLRYNGNDFSDGANTIKPYNTFISLPTLINGRSYSVTGVYIQYDSTKEIAPRTDNDIVEKDAPKYAVNVGEGITNGTVTVDCSEATEGQTVTITATPSSGYKVKSVTAKKTASGDAITVTNNKFTMPADAVTVSAEFEEAGQGGEDSDITAGKSYSWTLSSNSKFTAWDTKTTVNEVGWTPIKTSFNGSPSVGNMDSARGQQFGAANTNQMKTLTIKGTDYATYCNDVIAKGITNLKIALCAKSGNTVTPTAKVGDVPLTAKTSSATINGSDASAVVLFEYTSEIPLDGDIEFTINVSTAGAIYVKSISINN